MNDPYPDEVGAHGSGWGYRKETHEGETPLARTAPGSGKISGFRRQRVTDVELAEQL